MGIEVLVALGVAAAVAGASAQQAHATQVHAGQDKRDAEYEQNVLMGKAKQQDEQTQADKANAALQARNRAIQATSSGYQPDVSTNSLGNVGTANTKQQTLLGM